MSTNNKSQPKYQKDIEELEKLKLKARKWKPETKSYYNPGYFLRVLLTLTLLITFFAIGFSIAYKKQADSSKKESIDFVPEAKIIIPTNTP